MVIFWNLGFRQTSLEIICLMRDRKILSVFFIIIGGF